MSSDLVIVNLASASECLTQVARWHHDEWLKTRSNIDELEREHSLLKRIEALGMHLSDKAIPSTYIGMLNGNLVGSVSLVFYRFSRNQSESPWLTNVYVKREHRRKGIGDQLVSHACHKAKMSGVDRLQLYTYDQEGFYLKRGWEKLRLARLQKRPVTILGKKL